MLIFGPRLNSKILNPLPWVFTGLATILTAIIFFFAISILTQKKKDRELRALTLSNILNMDPFHFENYIAALMKSRGFAVKQTPKQSDYGVDLIAQKDRERWAVQIKHNVFSKTGNRAVLEAVGGAPFYQCNRAMVISTTEDFTAAAKEQARRSDCILVGRKELSTWIKEYHVAGHGKHQFEYW